MSRRPVVLLGLALPEIFSGRFNSSTRGTDVDAIFFENRRAGEIDARHAEFFDFGFDGAVRARQKAGAHAVRHVA